MIKSTFKENDNAQVLGLPMYLIIVMIVAVAVIAAVIFMIPQGTRMMNVQVTENAVIAEDPGNASSFTLSTTNVTVEVTTNDNQANPISKATVTLVGSGAAASGTTDADGSVTLSVTPSLGENVNEDSIKLTVKAAGYQEYTEEDAVTVYRLS
jgi:hypothetical protein